MPLLSTSSIVNMEREMFSHFKLGLPEGDTTDLVLVCRDGQQARELFVHELIFFSQCKFFKENCEPGFGRHYFKMPAEFRIDLVNYMCEVVYTGKYEMKLPQMTPTLQFHADVFNMAEDIGFKDLRTSAWVKFNSQLAEAGFSYFRGPPFFNFLKKMFKETYGIGDLWDVIKKHCKRNQQHLRTNKEFLKFEKVNPSMWNSSEGTLLRIKCEHCGNMSKVLLPQKPDRNACTISCRITGCGAEHTAVEWETRAVDVFGRKAAKSGDQSSTKAKTTDPSRANVTPHTPTITANVDVKTDSHIKSDIENTEFDEQEWDKDFMSMKQEIGDDTLSRVYESGSRVNQNSTQRGSHKLWGNQVQLRRSSRISSQSSSGSQSAASPSERRAQKRVRRK
ncbi:hypothetical protein SLS56_006929 [Neofusicoccum ribis]|uniref:BTB domain-containing protein n=1 Tax=Neofusicoccum ribis TaxID=45134 RepID=A0ABR3SPD6_9PEZI